MGRYGIRGLFLKICTSYLNSRTNRVGISNTVSNSLTVIIGVSQVSLLGPTSFLIFANDLVNLSDNFRLFLYVDDATLLFTDDIAQKVISQFIYGLTEFQIRPLLINSASMRIRLSVLLSFYLRWIVTTKSIEQHGS